MRTSIPDTATVRESISTFNTRRLRALAALSGVPFTTLWKIQAGETKNPGIETVRAFLPHVRKAAKAA